MKIGEFEVTRIVNGKTGKLFWGVTHNKKILYRAETREEATGWINEIMEFVKRYIENRSMKLYIVAHDEKCGHCNWRATNLYLMAESEEEAMNQHEKIGALCGDCMSELLANEEYTIIPKKEE